MRILSRLLLGAVAVGLATPAQTWAQACTGLCLQQVSCTGGATTSISGTVYAPNGTDPLPNVIVYIPNAAVGAFTAGVSCPAAGEPPLGSPLVGTTTATDGSFTLTNVPVGSNIPLVIQSGRWRRQLVIPGTTACTDTSFSTRMPRNQSEGDIPKFAIATGAADQVECVLRKVGLDDSEFTDPSGTGRVNLFSSAGAPGARISTGTPSANTLMANGPTLNSYDVLMLPCEGGAYAKPAAQLANLIQFANAGGRVYSSHFSYTWMYQNPPFSGVANWQVNQRALADGLATVDTTFSDGVTLQDWLQLVGASTTPGQIGISTTKHDLNGVIAPTQSWLTLNDAANGNPVMQFVFNTPIGSTNQCGRVLFNEYHVENPVGSPTNKVFPVECSAGAMTAQEKLLEFSLFELTNNGGVPALAPTALDFGQVAVGFTSAAQSVTWKNNSTFPSSVSSAATTGDFAASTNGCSSVPAGGSCQINVVFTPTAVGARTGTLSVISNGRTLTAALTGRGVPSFSPTVTILNFGSLDVGTSATQVLTLVNNSPGTLPSPGLITTGDYRIASTCGATVTAGAGCAYNVTFTPTATGTRPGTVTSGASDPSSLGLPVALTGTGVDFAIALTPASGSLVAGNGATVNAVVSPISGFAGQVFLTCTTTAPGSTCTPNASSLAISAAASTPVNINTTAQYTVVGYSGVGGSGVLWIFAAAGGALLWWRRRSGPGTWGAGPLLLLLAAGAFSLSGCSGKAPDRNAVYTTPGSYTYTVTATDRILTHSATYTLNVTSR